MCGKFSFLERKIACKNTFKFYKINTAEMEFIYKYIYIPRVSVGICCLTSGERSFG
jgi:hypothetical protein